MQIFLRTLLAVYLGHLLADFVFQTRRLVDAKLRGRPSAYLLHGLIHYLSAILLVGFFVPGSIVALSTHLVIAALALVHLLIDSAKVQLEARRVIRGVAGSYVADQLVHLLTVVLAAWLLSPGMSFTALAAPLTYIAAMANLADELRREGQRRIAQGLAEDVVWGEVEGDALVMRWPGPGGFEVLRLARGSLAGQELEG